MELNSYNTLVNEKMFSATLEAIKIQNNLRIFKIRTNFKTVLKFFLAET